MASLSDIKSRIASVTCSKWYVNRVTIATSFGVKNVLNYIYVGYCCSDHLNLSASITAQAGYSSGYLDLTANISITAPTNLSAYIKGFNFKNLQSFVWCIPLLHAYIHAYSRGSLDLRGFLRGFYRGDKDLKASLHSYITEDITANVNAVLPADLSGYLKVWSYANLTANLQSYHISDLSAMSGGHLPKDLPALISAYDIRSISAIIKGWSRENTINLSANIRPDFHFNLTATIPKYFYKGTITLGAAVLAMPMYLLHASLVGWDERNLTSNITGVYDNTFLHASINATGQLAYLRGSVSSRLGSTYTDLNASLDGYSISMLSASVLSIPFTDLGASLQVQGGSAGLLAIITASVRVFDESYKLKAAEYKNLHATIGYTVCHTRVKSSMLLQLKAAITGMIPYNLGASITPVSSFEGSTINLSARINSTNRFQMCSALLSYSRAYSVSTTLSKEPTFFRNDLRLTFRVIDGYSNLSASITAEALHGTLTASITPILLSVMRHSSEVLYSEDLDITNLNTIISSFRVDLYLTHDRVYYTNGSVFSYSSTDHIFDVDFYRIVDDITVASYRLQSNFYYDTDQAIRYGLEHISGYSNQHNLNASIQPVSILKELSGYLNVINNGPMYLDRPYVIKKTGVTSALGCYAGFKVVDSSLSSYVGKFDMTATIQPIQ